MREQGYYWLKAKGMWMIGYYGSMSDWTLFFGEKGQIYRDRFFEEIDERRIIREEPTEHEKYIAQESEKNGNYKNR